MITQRLISTWNFSLFMHHSKFVNHSGTPALWHSVLKLEQVTRFAVALVMHTIAFGQYSFDVRAAQHMSRTGDRLGLFRILAQRGVTSHRHFLLAIPEEKTSFLNVMALPCRSAGLFLRGLGAAETLTSQHPSADRHLIYL